MAFQSISTLHGSEFNSQVSMNFKYQYEDHLDKCITEDNLEMKSRTFAPSQFRCNRLSWFRLRGVAPDNGITPDRTLDFTAMIGTACHQYMQSHIKSMLGDDWVSVEDYLSEHPIQHNYTLTTSGYETLVEFHDIPIRFACDGIVRYNGKYYLLEIKTSDYQKFSELTTYKEEHHDQIQCYSALLSLPDVLVVYQDRLYGDIKCYELHFKPEELDEVFQRFDYVLKQVDANIAPDRLPAGDKWCTMCSWRKTCKQWG